MPCHSFKGCGLSEVQQDRWDLLRSTSPSHQSNLSKILDTQVATVFFVELNTCTIVSTTTKWKITVSKLKELTHCNNKTSAMYPTQYHVGCIIIVINSRKFCFSSDWLGAITIDINQIRIWYTNPMVKISLLLQLYFDLCPGNLMAVVWLFYCFIHLLSCTI